MLPEGRHYNMSCSQLRVHMVTVTLQSSGTGATLNARNCSRHFDVAFGGTLQLDHVNLINGGAQASGGAVKVRHGGTLIAIDSRIEDSKAESLDGEAYGGAIDASNRMAIDKLLEGLNAHSGTIPSVAYSPNNARIATVGNDYALRVLPLAIFFWQYAPRVELSTTTIRRCSAVGASQAGGELP